MISFDILPKILVLILGPLVSIISIPIAVLLYFINEIRRLIVTQLLHRKYNGKVELVSDGADSIWGYKKSGSSRNVLLVAVFNGGKVTKKIVESLINVELLKYKNTKGNYPYHKLKKIMTTEYGYICWKEDEHFDAKNHVRVLDKDFVYTETDIMNVLSECSKDMDESKPQWEAIIVPRHNDGTDTEKSTLVVRYLHSYMDGLSFVMLLKERLASQFEYILNPLKFNLPLWKKVVFNIISFTYGPYLMFKMLITKNQFKAWIPVRQHPIDVNQTPKKNYAVTEYIEIEIIKKIRMNTNQASVSNVIAAALVTSMKKVLPADRMVPEVTVGELIALLPYPNFEPRNRFTQYSYEIKTRNEDILEKVRNSKYDSMKGILGPEPLLYFYVFKLLGRFPVSFLAVCFEGAFNSFFISNVPFAKSKTIVKPGCELFSLAAWPPQPNDTGISLCSLSNNGQIKIAASADSQWLTNEELMMIMKLIPQEIKRMYELCSSKLE